MNGNEEVEMARFVCITSQHAAHTPEQRRKQCSHCTRHQRRTCDGFTNRRRSQPRDAKRNAEHTTVPTGTKRTYRHSSKLQTSADWAGSVPTTNHGAETKSSLHTLVQTAVARWRHPTASAGE